MTDPNALLSAARGIIAGAQRDLELGLHESACISAQRGAVMATEVWLRSRGQPLVSASVYENVCLAPGGEPSVRRAALRLDRYRMEEGAPHRSFQEETDPAGDSAQMLADARLVLGFVEHELGAW